MYMYIYLLFSVSHCRTGDQSSTFRVSCLVYQLLARQHPSVALDWGNDEGIKNCIKTGEREMDSQSAMGWQVCRYRQRLHQSF